MSVYLVGVDISTKTGDDGTTGLFYGGRVAKNDAAPNAYGAVDEAQACVGLVRSSAEPGGELDVMLTAICRDLYVAMAELATAAENRQKLVGGSTLVTESMVETLDAVGGAVSDRFTMPTEFVIPGESEVAARLDLARTVVRRAERECIDAVHDGSSVIPYLNRLSDVLWTLARWQEGSSRASRSTSGLVD